MVAREGDRGRVCSRRALFLGGLQMGLGALLIGRLYYLQISQSDTYRILAEDNRINLRLLAPSRGEILDRNGIALATNKRNYRLVMVPEDAGEIEQLFAKLSEIIDFPTHTQDSIYEQIGRRRSFLPITLTENLSWEEMAAIEVRMPELPGLSIETGELRDYPVTSAMAHVVGYVGAVNEEEIAQDPVLALPGFRVGKTGVEKSREDFLRGQAGTSRVEVNAVGRVIREIDRTPSQAGQDVTLTLDYTLQEFVSRRLAEEQAASAVVMDGHSGEVLALVSHPGFNPNGFVTGFDEESWQDLQNSAYAPFSNRAISGRYPPGSTFKMVVLLAALEGGHIDPSYQVKCTGHMDYGNHRFHCWRRGGHGWMDPIQSIAQSCDVYYYDLALKVGINEIAAMARRLGIGVLHNIDLPGEEAGLMPDKDWKLREQGTAWLPGETLIASIGQGNVLSTPLQLAVMTSCFINGGKLVRPHVIAQKDWPFPPTDLGLNPEHLTLIKTAMAEVTNGPAGTARGAQIDSADMLMAGKTGTSQVRRITAAERAQGIISNEDRPWHLRDHALFTGFAPLHDPRYVVSVVVEHGGGGSAVATPIARDILREAQRLRLLSPYLPFSQSSRNHAS